MKRIVVCTLLSLVAAGFQSHRTDFSGVWKLDKEKSENLAESFKRVEMYTLETDQTKDSLRVSVTLEGNGQHVTFPLSLYSFSGKEVYREDSVRGTKRWSKGTWASGGKKLIISSRVEQTMGGHEQKFTEREEWQYVDAKTLHISITKKYPERQDVHNEQRVFHRVR